MAGAESGQPAGINYTYIRSALVPPTTQTQFPISSRELGESVNSPRSKKKYNNIRTTRPREASSHVSVQYSQKLLPAEVPPTRQVLMYASLFKISLKSRTPAPLLQQEEKQWRATAPSSCTNMLFFTFSSRKSFSIQTPLQETSYTARQLFLSLSLCLSTSLSPVPVCSAAPSGRGPLHRSHLREEGLFDL